MRATGKREHALLEAINLFCVFLLALQLLAGLFALDSLEELDLILFKRTKLVRCYSVT